MNFCSNVLYLDLNVFKWKMNDKYKLNLHSKKSDFNNQPFPTGIAHAQPCRARFKVRKSEAKNTS